MSTTKRIVFTLIALPLLFSAGYDATRVWKERKVKNLLADTLIKLPVLAKVRVHQCSYFKNDDVWICDVEVDTKSGENDRRLLPVPGGAVEKDGGLKAVPVE